jgi:outer membrane protein insertion porin family
MLSGRLRVKLISFVVFCLSVSSCTVIRKYQPDKPFVYKNNINLTINDVSADERKIILSRLNTQLEDSSRARVVDKFFIISEITRPPVFDTTWAGKSADNMQASMVHLGYYGSKVSYKYRVDSSRRKQKRVTTDYTVTAGPRTLIDTFAYRLQQPELQSLAVATKDLSTLQKGRPVTKGAVLGETGRLVDLFRNSGYYKFTADELRVTGDTTIEALTAVTDDPFETLRLLAEATERRSKPTIRLAMTLNPGTDTLKLQKYRIGNVYILPDYVPGAEHTDTTLTQTFVRGYHIRYHNHRFRARLLTGAMAIKPGDVYNQDNFYKTINNFYRLGVWQSPGIDIIERNDSNLLDMVVKLIPVKKKAFEGNVELAYSASSTSNNISSTNAGNLLGVSTNFTVLNRNVGKEAIRMTNSLRAGIELNTNRAAAVGGTLVNSQELSFSNSFVFPRKVKLFDTGKKTKPFLSQQTFINTNLSYIRRLEFFNQQVVNINIGYTSVMKPNQQFTLRLLNFDFRRLYNQSSRFDSTIKANPFLRYSFTTALVMGVGVSFSSQYINPNHPNRASTFKVNAEESGLIYRFKRLAGSNKNNFFRSYLREFVKVDVEYSRTISRTKSAFVTRVFVGVGVPLTKTDTTLPFFKQYFAGGPNSMRGWPVRGIGVGGQPLAPFGSTTFNDRTGDIHLETNLEYRYNIATLFSDLVTLKGALFVDAGNIWNLKNTKPTGGTDTTQFRFKNLYKQLAVAAGTGFRFDFSLFVLRTDFGFRIKKPNVAENNGWNFPDINLKNIFSGNRENRRWRYENFNFTIGIDYPF